jgi:carbon-monoxide dehydrogenase iron sulfur subunit
LNKVLVVEPAKCQGCRVCEIVCSMVKTGEAGIYNSPIKNIRFYNEYFFYPNVCLQCETPHCVLVCPTGALNKDLNSGVVELTEEKCVGCKMCLVVCPFGAISMVNSVPIKCDLCGGDPMCVKFCRAGALTYGEIEDIGAGKRVVIADKMKEAASLLPAEAKITT